MSEPIIEAIEDFGLSAKSKTKKLFSKIGVVGGGKDAQYICRVASSYGMEVVCVETTDESAQETWDSIESIMDERILNWGATESEKRAVMSRIKASSNLNDLAGCDFVIESLMGTDKARIPGYRKEIFEAVEKIVSPDSIIATNSTTVIVSELADGLEHKERTISIHFMVNSVDSRIVEVTRSLYTSDEAYEKVCQFVKMVSRKVIPVAESVGLISVRMFAVVLNEACDMVLEGVGSIKDVEQLMLTGYGMRFGPFTLADIMGLDKVVRWMEYLFNEFGESRYKPNPMIKRLVRQRHYGKSTGKGFFRYDEKGQKVSC